MHRPLLLLSLIACSAPAVDPSPDASAPATEPRNVLVILADDLGAADVGAYAAEWSSDDAPITPALDRLAAEGVRYTHAWSNPLCTPTRGTLFTGRYAFRTGVGTLVEGEGDETVGNVLALDEVTFAEALPTHQHALFGKWHLGVTPESGAPSPPGAQGFTEYRGVYSGALRDYYAWRKSVFVDDGDHVVEAGELSEIAVTTYATAEMMNDAAAWISAQTGPWTATLALTAPHAPFHVPPAGTFAEPLAADHDCVADPRPCYKAAIESLDHHLGALLFDDAGAWRPAYANTLVVFLADNGPPGDAAPAATGRVERNKDTVWEGGVRVPLILAGPAITSPAVVDDLVNTVDIFATIVDAAGGTAATEDAHSLLAPPSRTWIYAEEFSDTDSQAAIRTSTHKLVEEDGQLTRFHTFTGPLESEDLLPDGCDCACLADPAPCETLAAALSALR